jgi:hypothetical protein
VLVTPSCSSDNATAPSANHNSDDYALYVGFAFLLIRPEGTSSNTIPNWVTRTEAFVRRIEAEYEGSAERGRLRGDRIMENHRACAADTAPKHNRIDAPQVMCSGS